MHGHFKLNVYQNIYKKFVKYVNKYVNVRLDKKTWRSV